MKDQYCSSDLKDRLLDEYNDDHGSEVMYDARCHIQVLEGLLRDLVAGEEPCSHFDHHGYCQTHGWFETDPPCPHGRAIRLLEETAA